MVRGLVCPHPGAIYMYITIIFKDLFLSNRSANHSQILLEASIGSGNMTKMTAMLKYGKTPSNIFTKPVDRFQ